MLWLQPLIAALTGWFVAWLAIYSILRPKQQQKIMRKLAGLAASELIQLNEIAAQLNDPEALKELNPTIEKHLDNFLAVKLIEKLPVISVFLGESTVQKIKEAMMEEIEQLLPVVITQYTDTLVQKIDIERMVAAKVASLSAGKLDDELRSALKHEFRSLQLMGAIVGFLIGAIQLGLSLL